MDFEKYLYKFCSLMYFVCKWDLKETSAYYIKRKCYATYDVYCIIYLKNIYFDINVCTQQTHRQVSYHSQLYPTQK